MYLIQVDHRVFARRDGQAFSLTDAVRELRGTGNARVLRTDGTEVVRFAGSVDRPWLHVPSGKTIQHRHIQRRAVR